jgi:N-acetyl-1-D-myo-inositol-2-amino-2-deoxy-alpha-D-glucopyranoside deacetylase
MSTSPPGKRAIVFVHAHPDDESINNAATMARYASAGHRVTLVTATRGDEGEVMVPDLAHLASHDQDRLGDHRTGELAEAMSAVGVTDRHWLGGEGRYRDSGMMGTPQNDHPQAFWQADLEEAADYLVAILRDVRPDVLVTYDPHGGYGHPDHIQTHRVATYAVALAAARSHRTDLGPAHDVAKVYWNAFPQWQVEEQMRRLAAAKAEGLSYGLPDVASYLEHRTCPDEAIAAQIDGSPYLDTKKAAMAAHETQLEVDGDIYALTNRLAALVLPDECYRLAKGRSGNPDGLEDDLFAGLG